MTCFNRNIKQKTKQNYTTQKKNYRKKDKEN